METFGGRKGHNILHQTAKKKWFGGKKKDGSITLFDRLQSDTHALL